MTHEEERVFRWLFARAEDFAYDNWTIPLGVSKHVCLVWLAERQRTLDWWRQTYGFEGIDNGVQ